jgi:hypothetical protein
MEGQESVRQILRETIEVVKEAPEGLQMIAFPKVFDFLAGSQGEALRSDGHRGSARKKEIAAPNTTRRSRSIAGPKQATAQALEDGFFDQPQTMESLAVHMKQDLALTFARKHLATALARLVRDGRLRRKQNAEGHYEYQRI